MHDTEPGGILLIASAALAALLAQATMTTATASVLEPWRGRPTSPASPQATACSAPEYRQFDFWLGDWDVFGADGKRAGTNHITKRFGGCVLHENWIGVSGNVGSSFNTYDPGTRRWHQTWVDNQGTLLLLDGAFANGAMTLTGEVTDSAGVKTLNRIRWSLLGNDGKRVRQLWESSGDGGKTWAVAFDGTYVRKGTGRR